MDRNTQRQLIAQIVDKGGAQVVLTDLANAAECPFTKHSLLAAAKHVRLAGMYIEKAQKSYAQSKKEVLT